MKIFREIFYIGGWYSKKSVPDKKMVVNHKQMVVNATVLYG